MISDGERDAVMELLVGLFSQTCTLKKRTVAKTDDGYGETWTSVGDFPCMVITDPTRGIVESAHVAADVNMLRVLVEKETPVSSGDRLTIGGRDFLVIDTSREAEHRFYIACACKVVE